MFDLILRGGRVLDGAGNVDVLADVAVEDGRIAAVGRLASAEARESVDVTGLTVCPGFVDVHCHSDALPFAADPLPAKILQGVTTEVNGNCGSHRLPALARDRRPPQGAPGRPVRRHRPGTGRPPPSSSRAWSGPGRSATSPSSSGMARSGSPRSGSRTARPPTTS